MKPKGRNTALKTILVVETIILALVCVGVTFLMLNSGGLFLSASSTQSMPTTTVAPPPTITAISTATTIAEPTVTPTTEPTTTITATTIVFPKPTSTPFTSDSGLGANAPTQNFDISNGNQILPDDILDEIAFFGDLGGGGGSVCNKGNGDTSGEFMELTIPNVEYFAPKYELMDTISFEICGVISGETISIRLIYPKGNEKTWESLAGNDSFEFKYQTVLMDPIGSYTIIIEGHKGTVVYRPVIVDPPGPRLYHVDDKWIFYKFSPNERIRVVSYSFLRGVGCDGTNHLCQGTFRPTYWKEYFANENGRLTITNSDKYIIGIGDIVGRVLDFYRYGFDVHNFFVDNIPPFFGGNYCPNIPEKLNIQPGEWVITVDEKAWAIDNADTKFFVPKGTVFRVGWYTTGNLCQSFGKLEINYLKIYCEAGMDFCGQYNDAVIPEGIENRYFVRSISRPNNGVVTTCADAPEPRLKIGQDAIVVSDYITLKNIKILKGTKVKVIAGPMCNDNSPYSGSYYMWFVQTDYGFEGWALEGYVGYSGLSYYDLEPAP